MINIIVRTDSNYPVNKSLIESTVLEVLQRYKIADKVEIGVTVVGERKMHQINKKFRGVDSSANILTFALEDELPILTPVKGLNFKPFPDQVRRLGDIVISYQQIIEDSKLNGISIEEEFRQLLEHGVKHLLGKHTH